MPEPGGSIGEAIVGAVVSVAALWIAASLLMSQ
jgi:hypothetical protein